MKAWFLTGPNQMELRETEEPKIKPGYLIAEMLTVQASVTEANRITLTDEGDPDNLIEYVKTHGKIRVPGHEVCARVIEVNPDSKFKVGDRVSTMAHFPCGECPSCKKGGACQSTLVYGITFDGLMTERAIMNEAALIKVPEKLTNSEAANIQPLAECIGAVDSVKMKLGDSVAVFGAGCLGMNTMQTANANGAGMTIVVDVKEENLLLATKLGASYVINGLKEDPVQKIRDLTGGGADLVFEAAGGNPSKGLAGSITLQQAVKSARREGSIVVLANHGENTTFPIGDMRANSKKLIFPKGSKMIYMKRTADLIALGLVNVAPMVTHQLEGIEQVPKMFEITGNKNKFGCINPAQVHIGY